MDSPFGTAFPRLAIRSGLVMAIGCGLALSAHAREPAPPTLLDTFLAVDARFLDASKVKAARLAFDAVAREASACATTRDSGSGMERARCVVDRLFTSGELATVAEPGDPESSTVTSVLVSHRGNCAALTALALAVADRVNVPMEAVVFPHHVVVRAPGDDGHVFELLSRGAVLTMPQMRKRLGTEGAQDTRVRPSAFPAFYLDNLAVRFAEAQSLMQADTMFLKAIEAGPRVARIRFNYGTFLLGENRLAAAEKQLRRAVHLDSRNAPAWANLGVAVARQGDTAEARRCFERALRIDPGNTIAAENLKVLARDGSPPRR
jgi:regulator of sirC expression with transglutaminase-like and TPR domain